MLAIFAAPAPASAAAGHADAAPAVFARAARAAGLGETRVVEVAGLPPARAPALLVAAEQAVAALRYGDATTALDAAIADASATGGRGLDTRELDDLFLLRGAAGLRVGDAGRARAWEDIMRAATLAPERVLDAGRFPPAVVETWQRASAEVQRRSRGLLIVRAPAAARVFVDGRAGAAAPAAIPELVYGEHFVRVEEPGHVPWATVVVLSSATVELDVPARAVLTLDDRSAADLGRHAGARLVLLATVAAVRDAADGDTILELVLLRAGDGVRRDGTLVRLGAGAPALTGALQRLLRAEDERESPPGLALRSNPAGAADSKTGPSRWWLWTGVAVAVVGAGLLGIFAARGGGDGTSPGGFTVTANPRGPGN